jgi:acetyl esterase/lipase
VTRPTRLPESVRAGTIAGSPDSGGAPASPPSQAVGDLAGRSDADREAGGEIRDARARVVADVAQQLEVSGRDADLGLHSFGDRASLDRMSGFYVADQDRRDPLLSPAVTADLTGLPPLLVQVGTYEMLLDDARRLAVRASDAEVDVILDITAKVPHVFQSFTGMLDEADEALDRAALFLRQRVRV